MPTPAPPAGRRRRRVATALVVVALALVAPAVPAGATRGHGWGVDPSALVLRLLEAWCRPPGWGHAVDVPGAAPSAELASTTPGPDAPARLGSKLHRWWRCPIPSASGRVRDPLGRPVGDADVWLVRDGLPAPTATTRTRPDGRFWTLVPDTGTFQVWIRPPADRHLLTEWLGSPWRRPFATDVVLGRGDRADGLTTRLRWRSSLAGRVTGPVGAPVADATVAAYDADDRWVETRNVRTAADGSYELDELPSGAYRVLVTPPPGSGLGPAWHPATADRVEAAVVDVTTPGDRRTGVDVVLPPAAAP